MDENMIYSGLFGKTRQAVLALLYSRPDTYFYTKQILDAVKTGRGMLTEEGTLLTELNYSDIEWRYQI